MAEDEDKLEKFDFDSAGEALGYISLPQARLVAMQTAREAPGEYGRPFSGVPMAFEVTEAEEDEDYYTVTLSFRPQGQFTGTPGQEQFFIEKEGVIAHRQVLALPTVGRSRRFPVVAIIFGLLIVGAVAAGGAVFATGGLGGSSRSGLPIAAMSPTETPIPGPATMATGSTTIPAGVVSPTATGTPPPPLVETATPAASTSAPTPTFVPTATPTLVLPPPTATPTPTPQPAITRPPTPTPTRTPTPTPTPTPVPTHGLTINGSPVRFGQTAVNGPNGLGAFNPLPSPQGKYPNGTLVYLEAFPSGTDYKLI